MIGLNMVVYTICTYHLTGWLLGGGMTHLMHYATELNSTAVEVNLVHSWDSQSTRPWMDIFIHMFDKSLPINLMPSYMFIRYKTWESHIVWRVAFHQVCQKALQARMVSWLVRFLDVPLVVEWSWDVVERKSVDTWSWWTLVALVVVMFTPD